MPTATTTAATTTMDTICHCRGCENDFPRREMSVHGGICEDCIDKHYIICSLCGTPVDHWDAIGFDSLGRTHGHSAGDVWMSNGRPCCFDCYSSVSRNDRWRPRPLDVSFATYDKVGSTRKFGVEVETSDCPNSDNLRGHTKFGAKYDPTCSGLEFDSPVLYGDQGFAEIRHLLSYAFRYRWEADHSCGCHTHFDMRGESDDQLWAVYYSYNLTYPMWSAAVSSRRRAGSYCQEPFATIRDIERTYDQGDISFRDYAYDAERYEYLNIVAYDDHNTFELRLLEGTLKADTICNWVALHTRFIDRVHDMSFAEIRELGSSRSKQFRSLVELIDDAPLTDWLAHRARYTGGRPLRGPGSAS